jgi:hypothetical protein
MWRAVLLNCNLECVHVVDILFLILDVTSLLFSVA